MQNSVNNCVFLENLTVKTTGRLYLLFDFKQGVNSAAHWAINNTLFFIVAYLWDQQVENCPDREQFGAIL